MPTVASVRLRYVPKEYWFDPAGIEVQEGDHVLVETQRGKEIGLCVGAGLEVTDKELRSPLKPILRIATEDDLAQADEMSELADKAMKRFRELVEKHKLDMKPVAVEFMYDGAHATFYFTAEERVDFRSLVRDLASEYHVRVDMRQIGVRDEARAVGGMGHCGQELCCARMGGEFQPVSIRMAKEQDLPLNPTKISGLCGRLMCCLRYEFDAYKDFKGRAPKKNAIIDTPAGLAKVVEFDTPRERVRVRFEDGKSLEIPVASMDTGDKVAREGERIRPCHVSEEAFDQIIEDLHHDDQLAMMGEKLFSDDPNLADETATAGSIERAPRKRRKRSGGSNGQQSGKRSSSTPSSQHSTRKRRRSVSVNGSNSQHGEGGQGSGDKQNSSSGSHEGKKNGNKQGGNNRRRRGGNGHSQNGGKRQQNHQQGDQQNHKQNGKPRPGQHSSTVSGDAPTGHNGGGNGQHRRRRRRSGGSGKGSGQHSGQNNQHGSGTQGSGSAHTDGKK